MKPALPETLPPRTARPGCPRCALPMPSCLCAWVRPTANQASVLVLQHPMERDQAKGSARLLRLSLARCRCEQGERFDPEALAGWLATTPAGGAVRSLLLFPQAFSQEFPQEFPQALPHSFPQVPGQAGGRDAFEMPADAAPGPAVAPEPLEPTTIGEWQLVLIDATWRKARKMLALNPLLQALPRWGLGPLPPSRYAIRKAQRPEQRSTLEAACLGLGQLEREPARYDALLSAFDGWVAQCAARTPPVRRARPALSALDAGPRPAPDLSNPKADSGQTRKAESLASPDNGDPSPSAAKRPPFQFQGD